MCGREGEREEGRERGREGGVCGWRVQCLESKSRSIVILHWLEASLSSFFFARKQLSYQAIEITTCHVHHCRIFISYNKRTIFSA